MSVSVDLFEEICAYISRGKHSKKRCVLLYKAKNKADVDEFHKKCDAQGPTVTILYGKFNSIFGGYTSQSWSSPETTCKVKDEEAFLFSKDDNPNAKCRFIPIKNEKADIAITCGAKFGPTFGGGSFVRGYDLQVFKRDYKPESVYTDQYLHLNGSLNINNAYSDATSQNKLSMKSTEINSGKLIVSRLEVYQVIDDEDPTNWIEKLEGENYDAVKRNLIDMEPLHGLNIKQYNIVLVGLIGAGKSSFVNTLSTVFTGKFEHIAHSRNARKSVTGNVKAYSIVTENKEKLNIRIFDIRGFEEGRGYGNEFELLLDGRLRQNYQFPEDAGSNVIDEVTNPSLNEKIHLVCMVEAKSCFDSYTPKLLEHIEDIKKTISNKGLPMVVIATKLDMLCTDISKNVDHLFKCRKAKEAVSSVADFYGVGEKHVFPIVNYINESGPVTAKNQLALQSIYVMHKLTEEYLNHHEELVEKTDVWKERGELMNSTNTDKKLIVHACLSELQNKQMRILVVGPTNSGKSSFIDSILSALTGDIDFNAVLPDSAIAHTDNHVSATEKFRLYCVKYRGTEHERTEKKDSSVWIGDTPGFQETEGIQEDHIKFIIRGNVPDNYKIINGIQETQKDFKSQPTVGDKIHCVCFVVDCENILKGLQENTTDRMMKVFKTTISEECPFLVVLTKCDKVSEMVRTNKRRIFDDKTVRQCKDEVMKKFEHFQLRQQQIFPVVNYVDENNVNLQTDNLIIAAFHEMLKIGSKKLEKIEQEANH